MRLVFPFAILLIASAKITRADEELPLAEPCDVEKCKLPSCRCSSVNVPGDFEYQDTPQFVLLSFDDAVNTINTATYRDVLYGRTNKNQCPVGATFFVNHEYSDYSLISELYNQGYEIGLKSISHRTPQDYWREASYETLMKEFADQKKLLSHFANIPISEIRGMRSPFLQLAGNDTYKMLVSAGLRYDASWSTISYTDPGLWPYTLDYRSIQDCVSQPCPTASIPGAWVVPNIAWFDLSNTPCAMVNSCFLPPDLEDEEAWLRFMLKNFEKHYFGSRAPFNIYINEWFIRSYPAVQAALIRFLDLLNSADDVFMVNTNEVLDWVQNPVPVKEFKQKACKQAPRTTCRLASCGPLSATHNAMLYYMTVCSSCPKVYPWVENPYGV